MDGPVSFFASYSRRDQTCVEPVVDLLRSGSARVFLDQDQIRPGDKWEMVLENNLESASTLLVFWSRHASRSEWVEKEWRHAMGDGKRIIPILLDGTDLPDDLGSYQFIDFRHLRRRSPWVGALATISVLSLLGTIGLLPTVLGLSRAQPGPPGDREDGAAFETSGPLLFAAILTGVLLLVTLIAVVRRRRAARKETDALAQDIAQAVAKAGSGP